MMAAQFICFGYFSGLIMYRLYVDVYTVINFFFGVLEKVKVKEGKVRKDTREKVQERMVW